MKDYFIRLLNYDQYANQTILKIIRSANDPEKPVRLMAHLLAAQQVWLGRCEGRPVTNSILWPDGNADAFSLLINDNHQAWLNYLKTLNPDDFEKDISYKNLQGVAYQNKLMDILAHLINHGTHHRAQIGQQLKFAGVKDLPITDYIAYLRN
jgi:uncharacterized damage-inducible protein DinB